MKMLKIRTVLLFGLIVVPTTFLFVSLWISLTYETNYLYFAAIPVVAFYLLAYYYGGLRKPLLTLPPNCGLLSLVPAYFPWVKFFFTLPTVTYYWFGGTSSFPLIVTIFFHLLFPSRDDFLAFSPSPQRGLEVISAADFLPSVVLFTAAVLSSGTFHPILTGITVAVSLLSLPIYSLPLYLKTLIGKGDDTCRKDSETSGNSGQLNLNLKNSSKKNQ